jgi:hypothetical protein
MPLSNEVFSMTYTEAGEVIWSLTAESHGDSLKQMLHFSGAVQLERMGWAFGSTLRHLVSSMSDEDDAFAARFLSAFEVAFNESMQAGPDKGNVNGADVPF